MTPINARPHVVEWMLNVSFTSQIPHKLLKYNLLVITMVHPMAVAPVFVAVLVILAIVFSRGKKEPETLEEAPKHHKREEDAPTEIPTASSGGRKKKRRSKKKSTKSESEKEGAESEEETEAESPKPEAVAAAAPAKVEPKKSSPVEPVKPLAAVPTVADDSDSSSDEDEAPKPKKAIKKPAAVKKQASDELAPTTTVAASSSHFDGWAVVEDKKGKAKLQKKAEAAAAAAAEAEAVAAAVAAAAAKKQSKAAAAVIESEPAVTPVPEEPVTPPAPVVEMITHELTVDSKKVGLLIGPKGVTKTGIQNATATTIQMPKTDKDAPAGPVSISVTGPELGVKKAVQALNELITKGYCALLAPEDFQESYVAVHPKYLKDIIGKSGSVVKALSSHTGVKITIPDNIKAPGPDGKVSKIKIGLTGQREKVSLARALIKDLTKYYHTTVTHPGLVHAELEIPANYFNYIIGAKGSEIKNIQGTHKVSVYIPDADSANPNVIVVGEPQNVIAAQSHIEKLITRADERAAAAAAAAAEAAAAIPAAPKPSATPAAPATIGGNAIGATVGGGPGWNTTNVRKPKDEDDEPEEGWVRDYAPTGGFSLNFTSILSENTKFNPVSVQPAPVAVAGVTMPAPIEKPVGPAPSSAWNNLSSAWNN